MLGEKNGCNSWVSCGSCWYSRSSRCCCSEEGSAAVGKNDSWEEKERKCCSGRWEYLCCSKGAFNGEKERPFNKGEGVSKLNKNSSWKSCAWCVDDEIENEFKRRANKGVGGTDLKGDPGESPREEEEEGELEEETGKTGCKTDQSSNGRSACWRISL